MEENREKFIFWTADGKIVPHLEYEFMESQGFGNYFPDDKERKNAEPFLVRVVGNIVYQVSVGYILDFIKNYILAVTAESGEAGPILDSNTAIGVHHRYIGIWLLLF
jgi:hypothetical protein